MKAVSDSQRLKALREMCGRVGDGSQHHGNDKTNNHIPQPEPTPEELEAQAMTDKPKLVRAAFCIANLKAKIAKLEKVVNQYEYALAHVGAEATRLADKYAANTEERKDFVKIAHKTHAIIVQITRSAGND